MLRPSPRLAVAAGAALLLGGASAAPPAVLASTQAETHTAVYQTKGYGPNRGTGEPSWSGNNYAGSGIAAWSSPAYLEVAGWGPRGQGYPAGGYGWYTAAGYSYPGPGNAGYLAYPRGRNYGYGSGIAPAGAWSPGTSADARGLYYVPGTGSYYAPLLPCRDADSCQRNRAAGRTRRPRSGAAPDRSAGFSLRLVARAVLDAEQASVLAEHVPIAQD